MFTLATKANNRKPSEATLEKIRIARAARPIADFTFNTTGNFTLSQSFMDNSGLSADKELQYSTLNDKVIVIIMEAEKGVSLKAPKAGAKTKSNSFSADTLKNILVSTGELVVEETEVKGKLRYERKQYSLVKLEIEGETPEGVIEIYNVVPFVEPKEDDVKETKSELDEVPSSTEVETKVETAEIESEEEEEFEDED